MYNIRILNLGTKPTFVTTRRKQEIDITVVLQMFASLFENVTCLMRKVGLGDCSHKIRIKEDYKS